MPDVKINVLHTLENFLDAYNDKWSVVVLEAIANALDAKATKVDIVLENRHISFQDNGPGMSEKQFKKYHDISASSKQKGVGIGFAGVGAKIYLAVWKRTVIHTETYGEDGPLASDLQVTRGKVRWEKCVPFIKTKGTKYGVKLRESDYNKLVDNIHDIIRDQFNTAMLKGLNITINGDTLKPWKPATEGGVSDTAVGKKKMKFPVKLTICKEDVPAKYRHIQYQVWGKTITTKRLEWVADIKEQYRNRIHCMVDAEACSKYLKLDKCSFKSGPGVADMYKAIEVWLHKTLDSEGYVVARDGDVFHSVEASKFFTKLFKDQRFGWLNPEAAGGSGPGAGTGEGGKGGGMEGNGGQKTPTKHVGEVVGKSGKSGKKRTKGGGSGLKIIITQGKDDPRDGWIDPENNAFMYNTDHPLHRKYEKNIDARNLRAKQVLFGALIVYGSKKNSMDVVDAFEIFSNLMTESKNLDMSL